MSTRYRRALFWMLVCLLALTAGYVVANFSGGYKQLPTAP
jgi:hypothetical protein